jgi:hypothetical protein
MNADEKISRLETFKIKLREYGGTHAEKDREWLNKNVSWVQREVIEAGCQVTMTISPPPAIGGLLMKGVDPFKMMFTQPYGMSLTNAICDMVEKTIGVLSEPRKLFPKMRC